MAYVPDAGFISRHEALRGSYKLTESVRLFILCKSVILFILQDLDSIKKVAFFGVKYGQEGVFYPIKSIE